MATQPDLVIDSRKPRKDLMDDFRDLLSELGTPDVDTAVTEALKRNMVPDFIRMSCLKRGLNQLCREAWTKKTDSGIPIAQPMDDSAKPKWKQTRLFKVDEAIDLLQRKSKAIDCDISEFRLIEKYYRDRFGDAIPNFSFS